MIYYLSIIWLFICSLFYQISERKKGFGVLIILSFLLILILGGFRFEVGADWGSYENLFNSVYSFADVSEGLQEKIFMIILFLSKSIVNDYSFFILSFFSISFILKFYLFKKYSPNIFISLIIYFFTVFLIYDLNGIRQGLAIGLVFLAIKPIINRNLVQFLLIILIASFIHTSAVIFIPFYWLSRFRFSVKSLTITIIAVLIFSIPLRYFLENSSLLQYLLTLEMFSHYNSYIGDDEAGRSLSILSIALLQRLFVFSLFLINFKKIELEEKLKYFLLNGYFLAIVLFIIFSFNAEFAARLSFYYKALEILIIPILINSQKQKKIGIMLLFVFLILSLVGTNRILEIPDGGLLPYKSVLW